MSSINFATREISCKVVYYGPGLSGKTTNLQVIHQKRCHNGNHPVLALDGRKSTYGIVRYVNDIVLDTVFTDCSGLAVWGDSISDPNTGKKIGNWQLKNGDKTQNVGPQYVFSRDTSIYASVENADWLLKEKSSSSSQAESSSSSSEPGSSSGTISVQVPLASASLKYSVERGRIHLSGLTFAEPVALFDVQVIASTR